MCEGATYGKVVPSRLFYLSSASWRKSLNCFHNFGKLKAGAHSAAAYGKAVPSRPSHLRLASGRQSLKLYSDSEKTKLPAEFTKKSMNFFAKKYRTNRGFRLPRRADVYEQNSEYTFIASNTGAYSPEANAVTSMYLGEVSAACSSVQFAANVARQFLPSMV